MSEAPSLLEELRSEYEAARKSPHEHADVPGFEEINTQMRKAFRWLEKASAYLDGLKPAIAHRFDLGHGLVFDSPRLNRCYVGQHERRIVGYPVLDEINIYYEITAAKALSIEVAQGGIASAEKTLDDAGVQYTSRAVDDAEGVVHTSVITVPPVIPAAVMFHVDYQTGVVLVSLTNVDRFDRVRLEFPVNGIDEAALEDLIRFMLGRKSGFLHRAPLAGIHGRI